eukprot:SAG31_NODE_1153_length_9640_cov_2.830206_2_plen_149_part_00
MFSRSIYFKKPKLFGPSPRAARRAVLQSQTRAMRAPVPCTAAAVVRLLSTLLLLGATAANAQVAQQQVGAALGSSSDGAGELSRIRVDAESGFFRDSSGRARLFRGVNAVSKLPPFHPQPAGFDSGKGCYFLVFVSTIREIRDFYREM